MQLSYKKMSSEVVLKLFAVGLGWLTAVVGWIVDVDRHTYQLIHGVCSLKRTDAP